LYNTHSISLTIAWRSGSQAVGWLPRDCSSTVRGSAVERWWWWCRWVQGS